MTFTRPDDHSQWDRAPRKNRLVWQDRGGNAKGRDPRPSRNQRVALATSTAGLCTHRDKIENSAGP